jgi:uncharacterized sulfatase
MPRKAIILFLVISIPFIGLKNCWAETNIKKPNIIFILADDLGWADLPVYGNKFNEAPNLDNLAEEGMAFNNAYAANPVCSPTRASILSGQYPARVGINDWIPGHWRPYEKVLAPKNRTQFMPLEVITIAEVLKEAGYKTGFFGKWHLGYGAEVHPLKQGFDEANVGQGFYNVKFDPPRAEGSSKRLTDHLADFGEEFIEKHQNQPFFLFLSHFDVHLKLDADEELIQKYLSKEKDDKYPGNAVYAAMIEHLDKSIGRILEKLKSLGLEENTIVVFYSDNGGVISENNYPQWRKPGDEAHHMLLLANSKQHIYKDSPLKYIATSNAPLRGEKGTVYEGGIREPMLVKWPGHVQPGTVSNAIISSVDFLPTFADLAGVDLPKDQVFDGVSLVDVFTGKTNLYNRAIYWHYPVYHHDVPAGAVRKGDWKLIENMESGDISLYNLSVDISETTDLSKTYPQKAEELYMLLKKWQEDVDAAMPVENPNFDESRREEWGVHPDQ